MKRMINLLEEELEIYREMLKISKDKTDIIVKDKIAELEEMTSKEEEFVKRFIELEKNRIQLLKSFSKEKSIEKELPKIPELCKYFPEDKEKLMSLREDILKIVEEIKKRTEMNEKLIKNSLDYINFSVGLTTGANNDAGTYEKKGSPTKGEARKLFDIKL